MKLAVKDIVVDPTIQIRRGNHEQTIQRYMDAFEKLPPVVVFQTPEGKLLADGFHRVAAAQRLGHVHIEGTIRRGTREDAAEYAVIANAQSADPLTIDERNDGIRRLKQLHPGWSQEKIADAVSVSRQAVSDVFRADEVRRQVVTARDLPDSFMVEIAKAKEGDRQPLAEAVQERGWSRDATRLAVQNLRDDRIPVARKRAILSGKADPVVVTPDGQMAVPSSVVSRQIREMQANDALLALERALEALAKLRLFRPAAIVETIGADRHRRLLQEMPGYIQFMEDVLTAAKKGRRLEAVR